MTDYKNEVINHLASLTKEEFDELLDGAIEIVEKKLSKFTPITVWASEQARKQMNEKLKERFKEEFNS